MPVAVLTVEWVAPARFDVTLGAMRGFWVLRFGFVIGFAPYSSKFARNPISPLAPKPGASHPKLKAPEELIT